MKERVGVRVCIVEGEEGGGEEGGSSISHPLSLLRCSQPMCMGGAGSSCFYILLKAPSSPGVYRNFSFVVLFLIQDSSHPQDASMTMHHCPKYEGVMQLNVKRLSSGDFHASRGDEDSRRRKNKRLMLDMSDVIQFGFGMLCHRSI